MKIGIYGGTFNPIHNGHIHVLSEFQSRLELDKLLIIPTYKPPHKRGGQLASAGQRLEMCRLAVESFDDAMEVSDIEVKRKGKSYTIDTLCELELKYPGAKLIMLMGEDMFTTLNSWYKAKEIFEKAEICVAPRSSEGLSRLEELRERFITEYKADICFADIPYLNVSSTQIRQRIQAGEGIKDLVPLQVEEYIMENKIYAQGISLSECEAVIRPLLSASRYHHSRCVSKEAVKLAEKYGGDVSKAAVAGMLHDIMKDTPRDAQLKIIERFDIMLSGTEKKVPKLLHAISGSAYIKHNLNIEDPEILDAVRWHTSGRENMSLLEKIIFVADFISEDRDYDGVDDIRESAEKSLDLAIYEGIKFTLSDLLENGHYIDEHTIEAYNWVLNLLKQ